MRGRPLDFHNWLTPSNLERALREAKPFVDADWSDSVKSEGLILDFRKVSWVDPVAIGRVILLCEACALDGFSVSVKLPRTHATSIEQKHLESTSESNASKAHEIAAYIRRRKVAYSRLKSFGFENALRAPHIPSGRINLVHGEDWSEPAIDVDVQPPSIIGPPPSPAIDPAEVKEIYSFRWISAPESSDGSHIIENFAEIDALADLITHPSGRVSAADAKTLAHVFLHELVENGIHHGRRGFCLIGAWARPGNIRVKGETQLELERAFIQWATGYPVIELMVGDSGRGIAAVLKDAYVEAKAVAPGEIENWRTDERIMWWAFDKWSTSEKKKERRGTRGLYRVHRVVRKYNGCISLRSMSSCIAFDAGARRTFVHETSALSPAPGTVAVTRLPVMLPERTPKPLRNSAPLREAHWEVMDLSDLDWKKTEHALSQVRLRLEEACKGLGHLNEPACLIVDLAYAKLPQSLPNRDRVFDCLIRLVSETAHPVAVVLANLLSPGPEACQQSVESFHDDLERNLHETSAESKHARHVCNPVLFRHSHGQPFTWIGVTGESLNLLQALLEHGTLSNQLLRERYPNNEERNRIIRTLQEQYHIVDVSTDGELSLHFNITDVKTWLDSHIARNFQHALENFELRAKGSYCTPSLEVVRHLVDVEELLNRSNLLRSAARALATKCQGLEELGAPDAQIEILVDLRTAWALVDEFKRALEETLEATGIRIYRLAPGDHPAIQGSSGPVLLFSDLILSETQVRRLFSQSMRSHHVPLAAVTVIDSRKNLASQKDDTVSSITILGHSMPVISLLQQDLRSATPTAHAKNVSPVDYDLEGPQNENAQHYRIQQDELAGMIEDTKAMYFDHVVRPTGRHFSLYLDALTLLSATPIGVADTFTPAGENILQAFLDAISDWQTDRKLRIDMIFYPLSEPLSAAEMIAKRLASDLKIEAFPVPRAGDAANPLFGKELRYLTGRQRAFSFAEPPEPPQNAVILDWGAMTGKSVRELIRLGVRAQIKNLLVLIFLDQLQSDEQRFLRDLRTIAFAEAEDTRTCNIDIQFLAHFPINSFTSLECPHCRQIRRLDAEDRSYPSRLIENFIKDDARHRLRPKSLEEVRWMRYSPVDESKPRRDYLDITDAEVIKELSWLRNYLELGRRRTDARLLLLERLRTLLPPSNLATSKSATIRRCLIALLANEWTWLKQDPLDLRIFRELLSEIMVAVAKDRTLSSRERGDAIVILRTVSKEKFALNFQTIFEAVFDTHPLIAQLLYCAFTYLERDYLLMESLDLLIGPLQKCASFVSEQPFDPLRADVFHCVNALVVKGKYVRHRLVQDGNSLAAIWKTLVNEWVLQCDFHNWPAKALHHLLFGAIERVPPTFESSTQLRSMNWRQLQSDWEEYGESYIMSTIIPMVIRLKPVFDGMIAANLLSIVQSQMLNTLFSAGVTEIVSNLRVQLRRFAKNPDLVSDPIVWRNFTQARDWLWNNVLNPGSPDAGGRKNASELVSVLQGCPCNDVIARISQVCSDANVSTTLPRRVAVHWNPTTDHCAVFCRGRDLTDWLNEFILNASKHNNGLDGNSAINIGIDLVDHGAHWRLLVTNDGTVIHSQKKGRGLATCKAAVRAFDGDLKWKDNVGTKSFEIELLLSKTG